ncbi:MAG: transposase [Ilumatobacteraceae bacterium]
MGRPPRIDRTGFHHVVNRGAARQPIFLDVRDRSEFLRLLGVAHERFGVRVHAFALMTNHYHLLVECPEGGLADAMHLIGSVFVRHVNERHGRDGPLFKGRYFAKSVTTDEYLVRLVNYVHRNPLAIVPADKLLEYRWSSLRVYSQDRRRPDWMRTDFVTDVFGSTEAVVDHAIGDLERPPALMNVDDLWASIEVMVDEYVDERVQRGASRTVAVALLDRLDDDSARGLLASLDFPSANAERVTRCRVRQRMSADPTLVAAVTGVLHLLGFQFVPGTN